MRVTIDDHEIEVPEGATLWQAALTAGVSIPVLCHDPEMDPVAVCRVCTVEVEGSRVLPAACIRKCEEGMVVRTDTPRVRNARKMVVELLMSDHPAPCAKQRLSGNCELELLAQTYGVTQPRLPATRQWAEGSRQSSVGSPEHPHTHTPTYPHTQTPAHPHTRTPAHGAPQAPVDIT